MSGKDAAALKAHLAEWHAANAAEAPLQPASIADTPLMRLARLPGRHDPAGDADHVTVRRLALAYRTRATSFDVWQTLARLDILLSDSRRLAPRFAAERISGDIYRLTDRRPSRLHALGRALAKLSEPPAREPPGQRQADIRILRCGPFGGETCEIVADACANHWRAGRAALWVLAHEDAMGGGLHVRLEAAEIARWAWAPDWLAARSGLADADDGIVDWPWLFERLLAMTGGEPLTGETAADDRVTGPWREISGHDTIRETLALHKLLNETRDAVDK